MNGKQLSEKMHALCPDMKVLFMSAYTENAIVHRGVLEPGLHFIQKPFSIQDFPRTIHQVLSH